MRAFVADPPPLSRASGVLYGCLFVAMVGFLACLITPALGAWAALSYVVFAACSSLSLIGIVADDRWAITARFRERLDDAVDGVLAGPEAAAKVRALDDRIGAKTEELEEWLHFEEVMRADPLVARAIETQTRRAVADGIAEDRKRNRWRVLVVGVVTFLVTLAAEKALEPLDIPLFE
jgi:hypothetical protein